MKPSMRGLLTKAGTIRTSLGLPAEAREEFAFEPDSGISREEQKDILQEIEKVATQNRIAVGPEEFAVQTAKAGVLFPVMVNLVAIIALAAGLATLYFFFQRGETQITRSETGTITAEGKLIETFKRESEAKLQEKDQQITQIQDRLQEIDKQRQDLQANMDSKVREKENQLKATLTAELDAEKAKLQRQGLSEKEIQRRIAAIEAQRSSESDKQLAAFRAQAEADRRKADENLKSLQGEFNAGLAKANQERQQVLDDSKKREAELQAQLEQKTREAASAQASSAQALAAMRSQKQQEDLVAGQLVGLYTVVKADISAKDFAKAISGLQAIRDYVNRADVAALPAMQQRREIDLFVVDSLTNLVQGQLSPAAADTTTLVAGAGLVTDVRAAVGEADAQLRAGNIAEAERLYNKALATIPEIARSHGYFTAKAQDGENARRQLLRAGLGRAEAAFDAGNFPDMLAAYKDALGYLPEGSQRLDKTLANILSAGLKQGEVTNQADQSKAAAPILRQGDSSLAQGKPADAISRYLTVLERYPESTQAPAATKGIESAVSALSDRADTRLSARERDLGAQIAALQRQVSDRSMEINGIKKSIMSLIGMPGDPASTDTAALMDALKAFSDKVAANQALARQASSQQQGQMAASNKDLVALRARLAALGSEYSNYTSREDPVLRAQGSKGLVDTKPYLDRFLGSQPIEDTFPGLSERIKRYDEGFLSAGRANAIQDALDVVILMSKQPTAEARSRFLVDQLKAYQKDKDMSDFVKGLQSLAK